MELLKEYAVKYGINEVVNSMGQDRMTRETSIVFPNG